MQKFSPKLLLPVGFLGSMSASLEAQCCLPQGADCRAQAPWVPLRTPGGDPGTWPFTHTLGYSKLALCHLRFNPLKAALDVHFVWGYGWGFLAEPPLTPDADMHGFMTGVLTVWRGRTTSRTYNSSVILFRYGNVLVK